jgi:hypothetical protein
LACLAKWLEARIAGVVAVDDSQINLFAAGFVVRWQGILGQST